MDIFDRIASDFVKEARVPSTKNIKREPVPCKNPNTKGPCYRSTGKPWTQKEVDQSYKDWIKKVEKKDKKSYKLWKKFEGASTSKGKLDDKIIGNNIMRLNERGYRGKEIFVSYGKPNSKGGEGDPKKKEQRKTNQKKRRKSKNFGNKKPSRRKDLTKHNKKATFYRVAGTGLKAVQSILPFASDRQANHFLHALADAIVGGDILKSRHSKIMGEIEVDLTSQYRGLDPRRNLHDFEDSIVGYNSEMTIVVDLTSLERNSKMSLDLLLYLDLNDRRDVLALCDALTKNIEKNILVNMNDEELDLAFGEVQYDVELGLPFRYIPVEMEVSEYDYQVKEIKQKGLSLHVNVLSRIEYGIVVEEKELNTYEDY